MVNRLIDLVVLVVELSQNRGKSFKELDEELVDRGYSSDEIEQAMFWVSSQWRRYERRTDAMRPSHRVLSPWEAMCLDTESYGYLLRLLNLGIIDVDQFDVIMARILPVGGEKVPLGELKTLAGTVIFDAGTDALNDTDDDVFEAFDDINEIT